MTAIGVNGEEYTIDVAVVHNVSDIRAQIETSIYERYGSRNPMVDKVLIQKATLGEWCDGKKMKDLFKVSDTAETMFTLESSMPSLVPSSDDLPDSLAGSRDDSSDVSNDDSSDDRSAGN